jgi:hypothetical protein
MRILAVLDPDRWNGPGSSILLRRCALTSWRRALHRGVTPGSQRPRLAPPHRTLWLGPPIVIDPDGVYDPGILNDRLLLGLKGTMSEFELNLLRQRSLEAIRQKARRGELQFRLPVGFRWTHNSKVEIDPDRRVQEAVHLVFTKMTELGSAQQVLLWFRGEGTSLPSLVETSGHDVVWKLPVYNTIWHMLRNPMYAGAYAFGKTESRTTVINGRARKSEGAS